VFKQGSLGLCWCLLLLLAQQAGLLPGRLLNSLIVCQTRCPLPMVRQCLLPLLLLHSRLLPGRLVVSVFVCFANLLHGLLLLRLAHQQCG
jgi:hypothetical protein